MTYNKSLRPILTLMSGSAGATLIGVAVNPLITRLVTPEEFGQYSLFVTIISIFGSFITLRFSSALIMAHTDADADSLYKLSILSVLFISLVTTLTIVIMFMAGSDELLSGWFGATRDTLIWLVPASLMVLGVHQATGALLLRERRYAESSGVALLEQACGAFCKSVSAYFGGGAVGLASGKIAGESAGVALYYRYLRARLKNITLHSNARDIASVAKRYRSFPLLQIWSQLLMAISAAYPLLLVASFYNLEASGFFALAFNMTSLPINLVAQAGYKATYAELSEAKRNKSEKAADTAKLTLKLTVPFAFLAAALLFVFGPNLFAFVFGEHWRTSGQIAQIIVILACSRMIAIPFTSVFNVYEKQKIQLALNILRFLSLTAIHLILYITDMSVLEFAVLLTSVMFSVNVIILYFSLKILRLNTIG